MNTVIIAMVFMCIYQINVKKKYETECMYRCIVFPESIKIKHIQHGRHTEGGLRMFTGP